VRELAPVRGRADGCGSAVGGDGLMSFSPSIEANVRPWPSRRSTLRVGRSGRSPRDQSRQGASTGGRSVCRGVLAPLCGRRGRRSDRIDRLPTAS
jgi:hypothetical protein